MFSFCISAKQKHKTNISKAKKYIKKILKNTHERVKIEDSISFSEVEKERKNKKVEDLRHKYLNLRDKIISIDESNV